MRHDATKVVHPRQARRPPPGEVIILCKSQQEAGLNEATREILAIPGIEKTMRMAEKDIAAGRLTEWRKIRGDV